MRHFVRFGIALLIIFGTTAQAEDSAERWLERMASAVEYLNYEGSLVYMAPGRAETFKVYHRVADNDVTERLVALDGAGAEIIRNAEELICIFPETRSVVVESRGQFDAKQPNPLRARLPAYSTELEELYSLSVMKADRILDRSVAVVDITPRDAYRYGYRIWLDTETGMPLKTQLIGEDESMPVEEIRFTEISMPDVVSQKAVQSALDTSDYTWSRPAEPAAAAAAPMSDWRAQEVPQGFKLTLNELEYAGSEDAPRIHLVYSDGLATISVFVDMGVAASDQVQGLSMIGAANAYSVMRDGLLITAMGEVPPRTVERFAMAMEPSPAGG